MTKIFNNIYEVANVTFSRLRLQVHIFFLSTLNFPCVGGKFPVYKHVFNIFGKFPVFSLSGKRDFQIPFPLCRGNPVPTSNGE